MLLGKEHSLVADSTLSSSPHLDSKSNTPTHIRRPVRTYGRRRDDEPTSNGLEAPSSSLAPSSATRDSIHNTAPPGLSEEVPPSSPPECEISMICDEEASPQSLPKFEFSWRKKLKCLDEDDDLNASTPFISNAKDDASKLETNAIVPAAIDDVDVFGGSHPSVDGRSPSNSVSAEDFFRLSSPQVSTRTRTRRILPKVIRDSDSDSPSKASSSDTHASALHLLNTPYSRSSSTQPTSEDDDMPVKISTKLPSQRKTARSSPVNDTRLTFTDGPSNNEIRSEGPRKKKPKIKVRVTCTSV
jgi:mediator of replication checkpoint protein 1